MSRGRAGWPTAALLVLAVATAATFWPVRSHGFVNWDDPDLLIDNTSLRQPAGALAAWAFSTRHMGHYQPLSWLVFAAVAAFGAYKGWDAWLIALAGAASAALLIAALAAPAVLAPLNKAWFYLGLLIGRVVSPIVVGALFFLLITPTALVMRLFGRDQLRLKRRNVDSYWIDREPPGPALDSFKHQF